MVNDLITVRRLLRALLPSPPSLLIVCVGPVTPFQNALLLTALVFRVMGVRLMDGDASARYRLLSFQFLSCVAPFIWLRLVTVFDLIKIIGTMQVIVFRMRESSLSPSASSHLDQSADARSVRESLIFFILLSILSLGFVQSMLALDAADGEIQDFWRIVNLLVQALLGSPDFDSTSAGFSPPFGKSRPSASLIPCALPSTHARLPMSGLLIYYGWSTITIVILLNVLIALFGSSRPILASSCSFFAFSSCVSTVIVLRFLLRSSSLASSLVPSIARGTPLIHLPLPDRHGLLGHLRGRDQPVPRSLLFQDHRYDPGARQLRLPRAVQPHRDVLRHPFRVSPLFLRSRASKR